jgi:hypothetical protein
MQSLAIGRHLNLVLQIGKRRFFRGTAHGGTEHSLRREAEEQHGQNENP